MTHEIRMELLEEAAGERGKARAARAASVNPKTHLLIPLARPVNGIAFRAKCQRAFRFNTGKQLRGSLKHEEVTCSKCLAGTVR